MLSFSRLHEHVEAFGPQHTTTSVTVRVSWLFLAGNSECASSSNDHALGACQNCCCNDFSMLTLIDRLHVSSTATTNPPLRPMLSSMGGLAMLSCGGAAHSKRNPSKSCAISVAIATYLYVIQTANGHLSTIVVASSICIQALCAPQKYCKLASLRCSRHSYRSTSTWFHHGY